MIKLDMHEADEILDALGSNWDPIKRKGKKTDISSLMCEELDNEAHKIKISYYGGKPLHEKNGTVAGMIVDRLINTRLTVEDAITILSTVLDSAERVIFKGEEVSLYTFQETTRAKWADKIEIKWFGYKSSGKRMRSGTLKDMIYDSLQITYNDMLSYVLKEKSKQRKSR